MADRIAVYPSRLALQNMKQRLLASQKGASLLRKRADALSIHYRATSTKALRSILELGLCMKKARMAMASSEFVTGNLTDQLVETVSTLVKTVYEPKFDNVAGVRILSFTPLANEQYKDDNLMVGLGRGGDRLVRTRLAFQQAMELIMKQAGFRYAMKAIDNMYAATNRRVNGIENVVIPRLERTVHYIISELDEEEREEYFRRKKVQFQKRKAGARRSEHQTSHEMLIEEKGKIRIRTKSVGRSKNPEKRYTITAVPLASYSQAEVKSAPKPKAPAAEGSEKTTTNVSNLVKKIENSSRNPSPKPPPL